MVILDLFSGTGGFAKGFMEAGYTFDTHYFCEVDKYAIANYHYNFKHAKYVGKIEEINPQKLKKPDLITFGFPCQDLSMAGSRTGLGGKRSGLFFEAIRLIQAFKPSVFVFENVKGLCSTNEGRDFEIVLKEIADLGLYHCQWQLLNTSWFLPQNRERLYFVGHLGSTPPPQIFPFTESNFRHPKGIEKKAQTILAPTIDRSVGNGGHYSPYIVEQDLEKSQNQKKWRTKFDQYDPNGRNTRSLYHRVYYKEGIAPTQMAAHAQTKIYDELGKTATIRKLTPLECERLQGFPDDWTKFGIHQGEKIVLSDSQRYHLAGNAVSVPVVKAIALRLKSSSPMNGIEQSSSSIVEAYKINTSNSYLRARIQLIEVLLTKVSNTASHENNERVLLRNGVIPLEALNLLGYDKEEMAVNNLLKPHSFSNDPLGFYELTRYNTWFHLHPEKVAGTEIITTSKQFPITIKGSKAQSIATLEHGISTPSSKNPVDMRLAKAKASAIRQKLLLMQTPENWYGNFSGLDGLDAIAELGALGELVQQEISSNTIAVKHILEKSKSQKKYATTDFLSFEEVIQLYNKGITENEIKAWVWYKRSLGFPMKGWNKYYLPNVGNSENQLFSTKETIIKDNHFRDLHKVNANVYLGKPTRFKNEYDGKQYLVFTGTDNNKYYVSEKDTEVRHASFKTDPKLLDEFVKKGVLFYLAGDLVPYPMYVFGNMYDRELTLEKDKEILVEKYGLYIYENHKQAIAKGKPTLISITNPDPKERPRILAISHFANNFLVKELKLETGIELTDPVSLPEAFTYWLRSLDNSAFKEVSAFEIIHYYLEGHHLSKRMSDEEKEQVEKYASLEGEEMFSKFLYEALLFEDQQKIDFSWNRLYNGQSSVQHHKIPVGFTCSAMFKNAVLEFTPAQREAIAFMEAVGSGIVAYDVGVGKTMSAIITLANALYQGKCSCPLIVVPNPTYKKWIREIIGYNDEKTGAFVPGVLSNTATKVNEWYNLGTDILKKIDLKKRVTPNTITVVTYEGFAKIGFSQKVMDLLFEHLAAILAQASDAEKSARDLEKKYQTYRELLGLGLKDTIADIDHLGFDYLVIDEAHNCKNIFADVLANDDGVKRFHLQGAQSSRGIKAFFLCNYIQRTYRQNVLLLTATPFTNSPLEIYSMLSLVGYESMKQMGITTLTRFMETFVQQTLEYAPNYKDEIVSTPVVKSYNNRLVLQKLIYNHINYKTGEEAGVKRPCKINLPRLNAVQSDGNIRRLAPEKQILTYLAMTPIQRSNQQEIVELARSGTARDSNVMIALGQSLDNALSPFLYKHSLPPEDYLEFIEESPKLKYTMQCIRTVKEYHEAKNEPVSGQIIYANRGKSFFPFIKEYLEKEIGYKTKVKYNKSTLDEVEVISSGISQDRKETIKDAFLDRKSVV